MDNQRIFKKPRILTSVFVVWMVSFIISSPKITHGQSYEDTQAIDEHSSYTQVPVIIVDVRPGGDEQRNLSILAFEDALGMYGELRQESSKAVKAALKNIPYNKAIEQGNILLESSALAYGSKDCNTSTTSAKRAILEFAATQRVPPAAATKSISQAYLYMFLCAHQNQNFDQAMAAAKHLRTLHQGQRPRSISETTWLQYPDIDAHSNQRRFPVQIQSTPPHAELWVDFERKGITPSTLLLEEGRHILGLHIDGQITSKEIEVTAKTALAFTFPKNQNDGNETTLRNLRDQLYKNYHSPVQKPSSKRKIQLIRNIMAAQEAEIAFIFSHDKGLAVWRLPDDSSIPRLLGQAVNAKEAGKIALDAIRKSLHSPILSMLPSYRSIDDSPTKNTSTTKWWIYGAALGVAISTASFILLNDLGKDTQRIEINLP